MKKTATGLFLTAILLLTGCSPFSKPDLLLGPVPSSAPPPDADKYGAYLDVDETFVEVSFLDAAGYYQTPKTKYIVNKQMRILSKEGTRYASIRVPRFGQDPSIFRLTLIDADGRFVPLDTAALRRSYSEKGTIVFSNATPGSWLAVYVEYETNEALTAFEYSFSTDLPVKKCRFTFSSFDKYYYETKSYGNVPPSVEKEAATGRHTYKTWTIANMDPPPRLDYGAPFDIAEPRISIVMRSAFSRSVFQTWDELAEKYQQFGLKKSFFGSGSKLRKLADSLTAGKGDARTKANSLLSWVQDNLSLDATASMESIDPDKVLETRSGSLWEITVVLKEMFEHCGIATDILVTRARDFGGFDPSFVTPRALMVPLVVAKIGTEEFLANPFSRGALLGEYPLGFFDLHGLSIATKSTCPLPKPLSRQSLAEYSFYVNMVDGGDEPPETLDITYKGYLAYSYRVHLLSLTEEKRTEFFQKMLGRIGTPNALDSCAISGLATAGEPLQARLVFHSPGQVVSRGGKKILLLSHLFDKSFEEYDTSRTATFFFRNDYFSTETVRIHAAPGKKTVPSFVCDSISNKLFESRCSLKQNEGEVLFNRTFKAMRGEFTPREMRAIYPDIVRLNKITSSNVTIE
jgi:hypothetical protein